MLVPDYYGLCHGRLQCHHVRLRISLYGYSQPVVLAYFGGHNHLDGFAGSHGEMAAVHNESSFALHGVVCPLV